MEETDAAAAPSPIRPDAPYDLSCQSFGGGGAASKPKTGSMTPTDLLAAYQIPPSTQAAGKIVALIELPSVHGMDDVNAYRKQFGIPVLPACPVDGSGVPTPNGTACFARVGEDGTVHSVGTSDCPGWAPETALDMDMVSAACPDCSIVLVEASSSSNLDKVNRVAGTVLHATAASNSWGGTESGSDDPTYFQNPGFLAFAASGDSGYLNQTGSAFGGGGANFPASAATVVAVGGTTLQKSGSSYSEVAWNDGSGQQGLFFGFGSAGGSGCSTEFSRPDWQSASGFDFGSCTKRASVDLSAAAQFSPGSGTGGAIAAYCTDGNGWMAVEGTSAASPIVAGIMVRLGLAGKDNHSLFYQHIDAFNDVTSGNNGYCSDVMCTAGPGWDGPTGLGTPNGARLVTLGSPTSSSDGGTLLIDGGEAGPSDAGPPDAGGSVDSATVSTDASATGEAGAVADSGASASLVISPDAAKSPPGITNSADAAGASGNSNGLGSNDAVFNENPPAGCSCRTAGASGNGTGPAAAVLAAGLIVLGLRRSRLQGEARKRQR